MRNVRRDQNGSERYGLTVTEADLAPPKGAGNRAPPNHFEQVSEVISVSVKPLRFSTAVAE
jgi:hypothetical protein